MTTTNPAPADHPVNPGFLAAVASVRERIGRIPLTDEDLVLLACEEISRTVTREERQYQS